MLGKKPEQPKPVPVCATAHDDTPMEPVKDGYYRCPRCGARIRLQEGDR